MVIILSNLPNNSAMHLQINGKYGCMDHVNHKYIHFVYLQVLLLISNVILDHNEFEEYIHQHQQSVSVYLRDHIGYIYYVIHHMFDILFVLIDMQLNSICRS